MFSTGYYPTLCVCPFLELQWCGMTRPNCLRCTTQSVSSVDVPCALSGSTVLGWRGASRPAVWGRRTSPETCQWRQTDRELQQTGFANQASRQSFTFIVSSKLFTFELVKAEKIWQSRSHQDLRHTTQSFWKFLPFSNWKETQTCFVPFWKGETCQR